MSRKKEFELTERNQIVLGLNFFIVLAERHRMAEANRAFAHFARA